jgi:hypothetical protein
LLRARKQRASSVEEKTVDRKAEGSEERSTRCLLLFFLPAAMAMEFGAMMVHALPCALAHGHPATLYGRKGDNQRESAVAGIKTMPANRHSTIVSPVY